MNTVKSLFENPTKEYIEKSIRVKGELKLAAVQHPYSDNEVKTWSIQVEEAKAYLANNAASTPLITALAENRNITVAELVAKIMENATAFSTASGNILGQQQKYLDSVQTATDLKGLYTEVLKW